MKKTYKVEVIKEGTLGALFWGSGKIPAKKLETILNERSKEGWEIEFMVIEQRRLALFWQREAIVLTLSKKV
ncbi:MAG: DUF4177 domain-containing protein [Candidatus Pacebacteria bacterium]|jgi:hypothetical protein|nr:DUF4177 domain-containing protein [Candidatus Paceibacterota bacterium]MBT4652777.1 DUF4177 domain-containing protein [Candidatus Paceibacterota bacterium]MBT6755934.1 DUF4177 domain-containing protein [Candidatus Paceibacterota bacterium]MBT6921147.1 DUF4177 domain-containing protein [Candidatus Paceibacterota bacterium]